MRTSTYLVGILGVAGLLGAGCGSDTKCGAGTVNVDGECVPENTTTCGTGTVLMGGECVPDGTVVCGDGTTYNSSTGECDPDITDCANGTVLVDGECVPYDDAVTADIQEMPEPNGFPDDNAGQFTIPSIGDDVTIKGCVNPYEDADDSGNLDPDYDAYYFQATGPTLLDITVDGLNGLSGGFIVLAGDETLSNNGWLRYGINPVDDKASRQVFIPKAGIYALGISDGRSLFFGEGFGGPDTCYLATIKQVAIPTPTAMTGTTVSGTDLGNPAFYSYDVDEGDILFPTLTAESSAALDSLVIQVNSAYRTSGEGEPATPFTGGLANSDTLVFVVDNEYNFSLSDVPWTLEVQDPGAQPLPTAGTSVTVNHTEGYFSWLYFDVSAAGIVDHFQIDSTEDIYIDLVDPVTPAVLGRICGTLGSPSSDCLTADEWAHFATAGRYYLRVYNQHASDVTPPATYDVTSTVTERTPTALTLGTAASSPTLSSDLMDWYRIDLETADWVFGTADPTNFSGDLELSIFDRSESGVIDSYMYPFDYWDFATSTDEVGRIVRGSTVTDVLVRLTDTGDGTADTAYDLTIAERTYADLTTDESTPISQTGTALAQDGVNYYLVTAPVAGYRLETTATPTDTECLELDRLDYDEYVLDSVADDSNPITLNSAVGAGLWTAFAVSDYCSDPAASYDFAINATAPVTYTATAGTLAYTDICNSGANEVTLSDPDEGLSSEITITSSFALFGDTSTTMTISSNGWLTLEPSYAGGAGLSGLGDSGDPNFVVAPFGGDLDGIVACVQQDSDRVTIQWEGVDWWTGDGVQFQAVLHDDNSIDFIYGSGNVDDSSGAAIGIEDMFGLGANVIGDFVSGTANPDTSWTLTQDP